MIWFFSFVLFFLFCFNTISQYGFFNEFLNNNVTNLSTNWAIVWLKRQFHYFYPTHKNIFFSICIVTLMVIIDFKSDFSLAYITIIFFVFFFVYSFCHWNWNQHNSISSHFFSFSCYLQGLLHVYSIESNPFYMANIICE